MVLSQDTTASVAQLSPMHMEGSVEDEVGAAVLADAGASSSLSVSITNASLLPGDMHTVAWRCMQQTVQTMNDSNGVTACKHANIPKSCRPCG